MTLKVPPSRERERTLKKYASINAHKCDFYTLHAPNQFSDLIEREKKKEKKMLVKSKVFNDTNELQVAVYKKAMTRHHTHHHLMKGHGL